MDTPEWTPANLTEQEMADALAAGDGQRYGQLLQSATLYLPVLPEPGSMAEIELAEVLPPETPFVPVFTSLESLVWMFGELIEEYEQVELSTLLQRWPDPEQQLAVNPTSPIATFLPPGMVDDLAAGRQSLVPMDDLQEVLSDEAVQQIRQLCLRELAGQPATGGPPASGEELRDDPPENGLEARLRDAVAAADGQAYVHALLAGDPVFLPTTAPVTDPDDIFEDDFPWRVLGGDQAQVVPVFSSPEMLARTGAGATPQLAVDFLHVLANWPSEDYQLYVNPGSVIEMLMPGEMVLEIVATMSESLRDEEPLDQR